MLDAMPSAPFVWGFFVAGLLLGVFSSLVSQALTR